LRKKGSEEGRTLEGRKGKGRKKEGGVGKVATPPFTLLPLNIHTHSTPPPPHPHPFTSFKF
jgi:hypothetical protein